MRRVGLEGPVVQVTFNSFADGVLEIAVPLQARTEAKPQKVEIREPAKVTKTAA